jgi:hypothetical protein
VKTFWMVEFLFNYQWWPLTNGIDSEADAKYAVTSFAETHGMKETFPSCFRVTSYEISTAKE